MAFEHEHSVGGSAERDGDVSSTRNPDGPPRADLVSRSYVLSLLRARCAVVDRERFAPEASTPGGRTLSGEELAHDLGWRGGHNAARADEAAWLAATMRDLERGRTVAGLHELRHAVPTVTEAISIASGGGIESMFSGEGG